MATAASPRHQLLQQRQRPRRPQRHDPRARRRQHARLRHRPHRRPRRHPERRARSATVTVEHDERALLRRLVRHPDRHLRPRLHDEPQDGDEPRRARPGGDRRRASSTRSPTPTPAATRRRTAWSPIRSRPTRRSCRARCRSSTVPSAGAKTEPGDDRARWSVSRPTRLEVAEPTVRVRLGTGADATAGGTIAAERDHDGEVPRHRRPTAAAGTDGRNQATLAYTPGRRSAGPHVRRQRDRRPGATSADLSLDEDHASPDPVIAGATPRRRITVTNGGPRPATNVVVTDTIDTGATPVGATIPAARARSPARS